MTIFIGVPISLRVVVTFDVVVVREERLARMMKFGAEDDNTPSKNWLR